MASLLGGLLHHS